MAREPTDIAASIIRAQTAHPFVDPDSYSERRERAIEHAAGLSGAILSSETQRYQAMLLWASLAGAAVVVLKPKSFKLSDNELPVDRTFIAFWACLLLLLAVALALRAYADFNRYQLLAKRGEKRRVEFANVLTAVDAVHEYRKGAMAWVVNRCRQVHGALYASQLARALEGRPASPLPPIAPMPHDTVKGEPLFLHEAERQEAFAVEINKALAIDERAFVREVDAIISSVKDRTIRTVRMSQARTSHLDRWQEVASLLGKEGFTKLQACRDDSDQVKGAGEFVWLLDRVRVNVAMSLLFEVAAPIVLAASAAVYLLVAKIPASPMHPAPSPAVRCSPAVGAAQAR